MTFNVKSDAFIAVNSLHFAWTVANTSTDKEMAPLTCGAPAGSDWVVNSVGFTPANKTKRVAFSPALSGLVQGQSKWIPGFVLGQQGLQIQLALANARDTLAGPITWDGAKSQTYHITDARAGANTITVKFRIDEQLFPAPSLREEFNDAHAEFPACDASFGRGTVLGHAGRSHLHPTEYCFLQPPWHRDRHEKSR